MIPLLHDFTDETVLVFGGGPVGARKATRFAEEASVVVLSPAFGGETYGDATLIRASPDAASAGAWIERTDPVLVVAATDDTSLNAAVESAARERGLLVNRADEAGDREPPSVVLPAIARDGPVVVGIGTGGQSPALSATLRDRIETEIAGAGAMADLTARLRAELVAEDVPPARRRAAIRAVVADCDVWKALDSGRSNARQLAENVIKDVTGDST